MSLTAKDVAEIVRLLEESSFDELDLQVGELKLSLRRGASGEIERGEGPPPAKPAPKPAEALASMPAKAASPADPSLTEVPSPLLGIFYRAPKPGEPPFVEVGAKVEPDTVVAIIEVMKLMNSVRAGVAGEVIAIDAANGALVEYGQTLLRVRPA